MRRRAAARRSTTCCFHGPPGLGKTTLAGILAREMGVGFRATSGPVIAKSGDLAALLTNLEDGDVLFIDEIHRLNPAVEEVLYPAMEDRALDLMIGEGPVGALGPHRPSALHPDRRDDPAGPADDAAARPLRHSGPPQLLHGRGTGAGRPPRGAAARRRHHRRRLARSRPTIARHAAHCRTPASPSARLRPCGRSGSDRRRRRRQGAVAAGDRRARPRRDGPALPDDDRRSLRRRTGRRGDARRGPVASRATRSRT